MLRVCFYLILSSLLILLQSCATYHAKHAKFHQLFLDNKLAEADALLAQDRRAERSKNKLLYYFDKGLVAHLLGKYEESNYFFEQAYLTHANLVTKPVEEALVFLINPTVVDYKGEDHEIILLHYYKALNFLQLGQYESALVECRRMNIKLNQLSSKYSGANQYRRDAFIHTFMGLVYQANRDYNNAFIAYRNAVEIYQEDYQPLFGTKVPTQLKKDLIYTAYKIGLYEQVAHYKELFELSYDPSQQTNERNIVVLWNNGLGPVKREWSINFVLVPGAGGLVHFHNKALGISFPFPLPADNNEREMLSNLKFIRVAFPEYQERLPIYKQAFVTTNDGQQKPLELLEDVNAVAFQVLKQRMVSELSKTLLRVALKKAAEYQLRKQNELLGVVLGGVNFVTEKADTRNWQTLPHSIFYTRLHLSEGEHLVNFKTFYQNESQSSQDRTFKLRLENGETMFRIINSPHNDLY